MSENASFAKKCNDENIIFVGPDPDSIEFMGDKDKARRLVKKLGIPLLPGYENTNDKDSKLIKEAEKIGFPVLLKASAGGGGKGMRTVFKENEFLSSLNEVKREAKNVFGDDRIIIEKYVESGRHIEVQILGDNSGNIFHFFERECTIQRRYQKIIEESPSKILDNTVRKQMVDCASQIGKKLGYKSLGTVEFIYDNKTKNFFFLEVNTRIQVEHPVTEEITGIDLVDLQLKIAQGEKINLNQDDILCSFKENGKYSLIVKKEYADKHNLSYDFIAAWISLGLNSSLDSVGLTYKFSRALAEQKISCNVIAGYNHDHIFVKYNNKEKAFKILNELKL